MTNTAQPKAMKFRNFSDEDFSWKFDNIEHTFKAGSETYLEDYKFFHFGKHLVDREMLKDDLPTNDPKRSQYEEKCLAEDDTEGESVVDKQERAKETKKVEKKEKEEEFPSLKDKK